MKSSDTLMTRQQFQEWLEGKTGVIGRARDSSSCPCANCIHEIGGVDALTPLHVEVHNTYIGTSTYRNEEWLKNLITRIDLNHPFCGRVTAETVRQYLQEQS